MFSQPHFTCRSFIVIYSLIIPHHIQPAGKVVKPVGDGVLIEVTEGNWFR